MKVFLRGGELVKNLLAGNSRHDTGGSACQMNSWYQGTDVLASRNRVWGRLLAGVP